MSAFEAADCSAGAPPAVQRKQAELRGLFSADGQVVAGAAERCNVSLVAEGDDT